VATPSKDALAGRWVHSHEEDSEEEMVFRSATHALPPSRGRTYLDLRADGSYVERAPGPVDLPEESGGRWSLQGSRLVLDAAGGRAGRAWEVAASEPDRLVVRKPQ
jgi:hypothetical protein